MAVSSNDQDEIISGINVTPMVDVVLVLLVIFMMAAPTLYNGSIKVELPSAKSGEKTERVTLKFTLMKDGKIHLDHKEMNQEEVPGVIKKALMTDPKADAIVAADKTLSHGAVVEFIDLLKSSGITRFALAVDSPQGR